MMKRHMMPVGLIALLAVSACAKDGRPLTTLAQAQAWATGLSAALAAASTAYIGPQQAVVLELAGKLQQATAAFAALGDTTTARSAALSITSLAGQIVAIIGNRLPQSVATWAPVAVGVISAFVAALPPPDGAPATPPPAMSIQ